MVQRQYLQARSIALFVIISCLATIVRAAAAVEDARLEARKPRTHQSKKTKSRKTSSSSASDAFCANFQKTCYDVALNGRGPGEVEVGYACKRLGRRYSQYYHFACKVDGQDKTQAVLEKTGGGYTVTTTVHGSTSVTIGTVTATATSDVTATASTTITTTDAVPTTHVTPTTSTDILTLPSTVTTSTTATSYAFSPAVVRLTNVVIEPNNKRRRRAFAYNDNNAFCQDFAAACTRVCAQRARSTVQGTVCRAKDAMHYSLGCYCKGGKVETQHALADTAAQQHVQVVTTVDTSSTTVTVTSTQTQTKMQTLTSTTHTSTPTTVATSVSTSVVTTTTYNPVATEVVPTTTQILLSPTGYIGAYDLGTSNYRDVLDFYPEYPGVNYGLSKTVQRSPVKFMAVRDANSLYYKLIHADGSNAFTAGGGIYGYDYEPSSTDVYTNIKPNSPTSCDTASTTAGPPAGNSGNNKPCEQYVLRFKADDLTGSLNSFNASLVWVNPTGSATTDTSNLATYWGISSRGSANLQNARNGHFFDGTGSILIDLRFPLTTIPP